MKKSIFYVLVVLMALSLTLGAVSAEDAAADAAAADDVAAVDVAPAADGNAAGGDNVQPVQAEADDPNNIGETDYTLLWSVVALNYGPDTAYDTVVRITGSDNLFLTNYKVLDGSFDPATSKWYVGDMPAGTASALLLETYKVDVLLDQGYGPYYVDALIVSDSFDPDLSNNYDIAWVGLDASAEETTNTLPEAGNPLAMALLALFAIGIGGIKRRF